MILNLDIPIDIQKIGRERVKIKSSSSNFIKNSSEIMDIFDYNSSFTSISSLDNRMRNRTKRKINKIKIDEDFKCLYFNDFILKNLKLYFLFYLKSNRKSRLQTIKK